MWDEKSIKELVKRIVRYYQPHKVILFGSAARGDTDEYSDIDLIIVAPSDKSFVGRLRESADVIPEGRIDLLIYTPEEFQDMLDKGSYFIETALKEGKCLYEKA